jgi:PAS domain S-box-containing protein
MPQAKPSLKRQRFSAFWLGIIQTRLFLCLLVASFAFLDPSMSKEGNWFALFLIGYFTVNLSLGFFNTSTLQNKKIRIIPDLVDIIFVSLIIILSGSETSWFILYLFPIASVARYFGRMGSILLASFASLSYTVIYVASDTTPALSPFAFILRIFSFFGVAAVAGNLAKSRYAEEMRLIKVSEEVNDQILNEVETGSVFRYILKRALEFTTSDMGHIRLTNSETPEAKYEVVTAIGHPADYNWELRHYDDSLSAEVIRSKKPKIINSILKQDMVRRMGSYFRFHHPRPRSALFYPLIAGNDTLGVIAVYSRKRFHYTKNELMTLGSFAPLLIMTRKTAELYGERAAAAEERKERLKMLFEIGERLKTDTNLEMLFDGTVKLSTEEKLKTLIDEVVKLTIERLGSEEAALFFSDPTQPDRINKVAVRGPSDYISKQLSTVETSYSSGESLAGKTFLLKEPKFINDVPESVKYVDVYQDILPSGVIRHYMSSPLLVGEEALGVIRVINKRSPEYAPGKFKLSDKGFSEEDFELLQVTASQVAASIRNAKIAELLTELTESEQYLDTLIQKSPSPFIALDEKGCVRTFNKACEEIWGYTFEQVEGWNITKLYASESHARDIGRELWKSEGKKVENFPASIKNSEGNIIPISLSASWLLNEKGDKKVGSIGVFKDLREVQRLEAQVLQSAKLAAIGRLAHTVGHDVKTKIGAALYYVETLTFESQLENNSERAEMCTEIRDMLWEAVDMFQNMLAAAKPKTPEMVIQPAANLFSDIHERLTRQAKQRNIRFEIEDESGEQAVIEADASQLHQVFYNLFSNSIFAIEKRRDRADAQKPGLIKVSVSVNDGHVNVDWEDNGCGIPEQAVAHIFNAFFTDKESGNGLGLFNVKTIINAHKGNISVTSKEGELTRFVISLPLASNEMSEQR